MSSRLNYIGYENAGVVRNCEYSHIENFSVKKNINPYNSFKHMMQSRYVYAKKYLKFPKYKLIILKIAIKYGLFEKKLALGIKKYF